MNQQNGDLRWERIIQLEKQCRELEEKNTLLIKALETIRDHCRCNRNTKGFDYGDKHKRLGKPTPGARWLTPIDIVTVALAWGINGKPK